jgi:tetratricopeptide (TPR) repeat protein
MDLLATEHHDIPLRHRSMEAALGASWRRLAPEQQRAFKGLTVFRGGFTRTAAQEVAGATLPLLVTLANKSWLTYDRQEDRYHVHELLRQYGAAKLGDDFAHEQEAQERHSAHFCSFLQEREADWFGPRQKEAASEVRDEIDNIRRAWRWAAAQGNSVLLDRGLQSLCRFYTWEGRLKDGQTACRLAGDGLSRAPDGQQFVDAQHLALWARVFEWESGFARKVAQKEALLERSQQLLDRATQTGRDTRTEQASIFLGKAYAVGNTNVEEAIRLGNLGLALFRDLGNRAGEAEALQVVGYDYLSMGEYQLAENYLRESLKIRRQMGDKGGIAETINQLGSVGRYLGRFKESEALYRQGLDLYRQLGNHFREARWLTSLSLTLSWAGKFQEAEEAARQAIEIDRDLGQHPNPWRLNPLIMAIFHEGYNDEARSMAADNLEFARQRGILTLESWTSVYLGNIAFIEGRYIEARRYLQQSVILFTKLKHVQLATSQAFLSYALRAQGDIQPARKNLVRVLHAGIETHFIFPIMNCLPLAALLAADADRPERAVELHGLAQQFGYIRNSRWFADVTCRELDEVRASLLPDVAAAAEARGREMDVWETAEALLGELDGS